MKLTQTYTLLGITFGLGGALNVANTYPCGYIKRVLIMSRGYYRVMGIFYFSFVNIHMILVVFLHLSP